MDNNNFDAIVGAEFMYKLPPMGSDIKTGTAWIMEDKSASFPGSQSRNCTSGCLTPDPENEKNTICTSITNSPKLCKNESQFTFDQNPSTSVDTADNNIEIPTWVQDNFRDEYLKLSRNILKAQKEPSTSVKQHKIKLSTLKQENNNKIPLISISPQPTTSNVKYFRNEMVKLMDIKTIRPTTALLQKIQTIPVEIRSFPSF